MRSNEKYPRVNRSIIFAPLIISRFFGNADEARKILKCVTKIIKYEKF